MGDLRPDCQRGTEGSVLSLLLSTVSHFRCLEEPHNQYFGIYCHFKRALQSERGTAAHSPLIFQEERGQHSSSGKVTHCSVMGCRIARWQKLRSLASAPPPAASSAPHAAQRGRAVPHKGTGQRRGHSCGFCTAWSGAGLRLPLPFICASCSDRSYGKPTAGGKLALLSSRADPGTKAQPAIPPRPFRTPSALRPQRGAEAREQTRSTNTSSGPAPSGGAARSPPGGHGRPAGGGPQRTPPQSR